MPELPEVETMVRGIRPHVEGRVIQCIRRCRCACKPISIRPHWSRLVRRVRGQTVETVRRVAKRVVLDLSSGESLVVEPRMTGLLLLADPPDPSHLRIEWQFADAGKYRSLWFWDRRGLGTLRLFTHEQLAEALGPDRLGPDALAMTGRDWGARCASTGRAIKVAMLDQKLCAGIGNLYASEILHAAAIHPACRADRLRPAQIRRLAAAAQEVLSAAVRNEGSTLSDGTYRNALNRNGRYQSAHRVYGREHQPCLTCGRASVCRLVQAQRSTFFCPACQRPHSR